MKPLDLVPPIAEAKRVGKLVAALAIAVVVLVGLVSVLGFMADPFGWRKHKIERLEQTVEHQADDLAGRTLETRGEREGAQRVEITVRQAAAAQAATQDLAENARTASDAQAPVDADRLARLRVHDEQLCLAAPDLAGCAAATQDAR